MRQEAMQLTHDREPISFTFLLKGVVGYSLAALLAVGAAASFVEFDTTIAQAAGAIVGAIVGAFVALRG
jgi:hypothetical protein